MSDEEYLPEWKFRTLADAYEYRKPTEYVVDKFFATESLNIVYGAPGSLKSMILADMVAHVVGGTNWLPGALNGGIPVMTCPVLWLDMDNGTRRSDERFEAVGRAHKLPADASLHYLSMPNPPFAANDIDTVLMLRDAINVVGAKMVIIDNLSLVTGSVEENSAEMAKIMGNFRVLAERTKAAIIVVHHQRKGGAGQGRAGDALRGHSSIEGAIDLAIQVVREKDSPEITLRSTKTRGVDVPFVIARFHYEHKPGTNDLARAWFDGVPVIRGENPVRDAIMAVLSDSGEMTKGRLADAVYELLNGEYGINKIRNWIGELIEVTGELDVRSGDKGAQIICLV